MGERLEGKRCVGCAWFDGLEERDNGVEGTGYCRKLPPFVLKKRHRDAAGMAEWPVVDESDWCGEWKDGHR
jgi:hypothetical protein